MDVFNTGSISAERVNSLIKTMKAFSYLLEVYQPIALTICATAAMREAANSADIVKRIKEETNLEVKIIDGLTEARIISQYNSNSLLPDGERTMFVDVGGGSTELSVIENHRFIASESFNIGTIRFLYEKVEDKEWERLKKWLIKFRGTNPDMICMGSGGNINKITKLYGSYKNDFIVFKDLQRACKQMEKLSVTERIDLLGLRPDRADVIVPAAKIFIFIMEWARLGKVFAPKIGLADGLVLKTYEDMKKDGLIK
jgi:exopolyphosphatase/guanosine-5'-triphosphate,3'-diphosphate pyrophosphatase